MDHWERLVYLNRWWSFSLGLFIVLFYVKALFFPSTSEVLTAAMFLLLVVMGGPSIHLAPDRIQWWVNEFSGSIKGGNFTNYLYCFRFLRRAVFHVVIRSSMLIKCVIPKECAVCIRRSRSKPKVYLRNVCIVLSFCLLHTPNLKHVLTRKFLPHLEILYVTVKWRSNTTLSSLTREKFQESRIWKHSGLETLLNRKRKRHSASPSYFWLQIHVKARLCIGYKPWKSGVERRRWTY
jgi:hypothetical protein